MVRVLKVCVSDGSGGDASPHRACAGVLQRTLEGASSALPPGELPGLSGLGKGAAAGAAAVQGQTSPARRWVPGVRSAEAARGPVCADSSLPFLSRLLYSLAFNARFLRHLWVLVSSMTTRMITGYVVRADLHVELKDVGRGGLAKTL